MDRVLIAEDHPLFRSALANAVRRMASDCEVVECASLADALLSLASSDVAMILLDLKMSDSDVTAQQALGAALDHWYQGIYPRHLYRAQQRGDVIGARFDYEPDAPLADYRR